MDDVSSGLPVLFDLVARATGCDFSHYKRATLVRRIDQRCRRLGCEGLPAYLDYIRAYPDEVKKLQRHLLIGVTSFFRNPRSFDRLAEEWSRVWPGRAPGPLRLWSCACSTGEEAYSLAIQFLEFAETHAPGTEVKVFATDLEASSVDKARRGWYPDTAVTGLTSARLHRWFDREGRGWRARKELREKITFAVHNVLTDPPFGHLDVISCRNLFIYLEPEVQTRLAASFAFALAPGGLLFLGSSESVDGRGPWFHPIDKKHKIHRRPDGRGFRPPVPAAGPAASVRERQSAMNLVPSSPAPRDLTVKELVLDLLARDYAVPSVLVDRAGQIQFVWGDTGPIFRRRAGRPSDLVTDNVVDSLQVALANSLAAVVAEGRSVTVDTLRLPPPDGRPVRLVVRPIEAPVLGSPHYLVVFQILSEVEGRGIPSGDQGNRSEGLERELNDTRLYLRNLILKLETANEELAAGNEETQSMNEELQSSNEELESSREELQATNDELESLNAAYAQRIEELGRLHNDLANLISSSRLGMVFLDRQLKLVRFTPEAAQVLPLKTSDLGSPLPATGHLLGPGFEEVLARVLRDLHPEEREVVLGLRTFLLRVLPYRTTEDRIEGLVLTFTDLTELRAAEVERNRSEHQFRALFDNNPDALVLADLVRSPQGKAVDYRLAAVNPTVERWCGQGAPRLQGLLGSETTLGLDRSWLGAMEKAVETGQSVSLDHYHPGLDRHLQVWVFGTGGPRVGLLMADVTETRRRQDDLVRSEALLRSTLTSMDDKVVVFDADNAYLKTVSDPKKHRSRHAWIPVPGLTLAEMGVAPEAAEAQARAFDAVKAGAPVAAWTFQAEGEGGQRWFHARLTPRFGPDGSFEGAVQVNRDVTDLLRAEAALAESEAQLRGVFDASPLGLGLAKDGVLVRANAALARMFGHADVTGRRWTDLLVPGTPDQGLRPDGTTFPLRLDLVETEPGLQAAVVQDLSERQRMERTVLNSQRLESLGVLAGGIAHDFNNLLGGLFGFVQLARKATPDESPAARHLDRAFAAFERAQDLTRQLLTFSKGGDPVKQVLDLRGPLEASARFILSGGNLRLVLDLPQDLWPCEVDRHQLGQVIDNLGLNARQAMPQGGQITLRARNVAPDEGLPAGLEPGPYVVVSLVDQGPGIPPDVLPRVFDPFFSTKQDGSGLGLATVHSILRKHGGLAEADSPPGGGAEFRLWFPATPPGTEDPEGAHRRLLVLDDEELILDTALELLEDLGYEAVGVQTGTAALEVFRQARREGHRFGFFLTDLTLPGEKGGLAVAQQLQRLDPALKCAASSGYSEDPVVADPGARGLVGFLPKPYTRDQLAAFLERHFPLSPGQRSTT